MDGRITHENGGTIMAEPWLGEEVGLSDQAVQWLKELGYGK
jgi:hypothetical protein